MSCGFLLAVAGCFMGVAAGAQTQAARKLKVYVSVDQDLRP